MAGEAKDLQIGDVDSYSEILARPNTSGHNIAHIPSLAALLLRAEELKGSPLSEAEVLRIRDGANVTVIPDAGETLEKSRGYRDIDPTNCWEEWQTLRTQFASKP